MITLVSLLGNKEFESLLDEVIFPLVFKYDLLSQEVKVFTKGYVAGYNKALSL